MEGSTVELIKSRLDIVDFLRGYLQLSPAGKNFKACCPFHKEKTPSFMISPDRQSWHCFGCGEGGDAFTFLMKHENVEFGEALKILAEKTGVELKRLNPGEYKFAGLLYELNEAAKDFFKKKLEVFTPAQKYLEERGLTKETIAEFELGWAPAGIDELNVHFINNLGHRPDDVVRAGLAFKTERGLQMDRFRGRIMFPIHNHLGKVVGFTGRILPQFDRGDSGKYVNSPETPIFMKSKLLYGFWKSKNYIKDADAAYLVEGQMDCLMSWQTGLKNVVASSGTALTTDHLRAIRRLTDKLVLSFDTDEAGQNAGERAIDLAEANDFSIKIVTLGDYKDPADAAKADPEFLRGAVKNAVAASEFYFKRYLKDGGDERERLKGVRTILQKIKNITSPIERNSWIRELANRTKIEEAVLLEEMQKLETHKGDVRVILDEQPILPKKVSRMELLAEELLAVAHAEGNYALLDETLGFLPPDYRAVAELLKAGKTKADEPRLDELINLIILRAGEGLTAAEAGDLKKQVHSAYIRERRKNLAQCVKEAEARNDASGLEAALKELQELPVI